MHKTTNALKATKYVRELLLSDNRIVGKVGNRIHGLDTKKDTPLPFIVLTRASVRPEYMSKDIHVLDTTSVQCAIVANHYAESVDIAQMVREALDLHSLQTQDNTISSIKMTSASEDYMWDSYVQMLEFTITFE